MTVVPQRNWTCDHCHAKEYTNLMVQPGGWRGVEFTRTPLSAPEARDRIHLCGACVESFTDWLADTPKGVE